MLQTLFSFHVIVRREIFRNPNHELPFFLSLGPWISLSKYWLPNLLFTRKRQMPHPEVWYTPYVSPTHFLSNNLFRICPQSMTRGRDRCRAAANCCDFGRKSFIPHPGGSKQGKNAKHEHENDGNARITHGIYRGWNLPPERIRYLDSCEEYGLRGQPVEETTESHQRNCVGVGYL